MRLIDADKLKKDILDLPDCYNGFSDTFDKACIIGVIDEQPSAQPEVMYYPQVDGVTPSVIAQPERKSGKWRTVTKKSNLFDAYSCSECNGLVYGKTNFCPYCGCEMER